MTTTERARRSQPRVVVRSRVRHYRVDGSSALELRASMDRLGPKDPASGESYAAFTRWRIVWSYRFARGGACALDDVVVRARIAIVLPRWHDARRAEPALAAEWRRFLAALRRHEDGHAAIGRRATARIAHRLGALRAFRSCAPLDRAANVLAERILAEAHRAEIAYDERTRHGDTQGARFPG